MPTPSESLQLPQTYWNHAAETYGEAFADTFIGKMTRDVVWETLDAGFKPGSRVLEVNCGTGIDAIHLARRGVSVLACDISSRMVEIARASAKEAGVHPRLDFRVLPTEQLSRLESELKLDGAFSNFCGLNCVQDLAEVSRNLARLLKPGAPVIVCMLGTFTLWEKLRYFAKGDWKNVFQNTQASDSEAWQSGVKVLYFSRRHIMESFAPGFTLRKFKGIAIAVPPSNMDHWARRFPAIARALGRVDRVICNVPVLRSLGGCILLEFERTARPDDLEAYPAARS
jgi:ubiquinone/menaquinone biosynthesis C-methylase UbiE